MWRLLGIAGILEDFINPQRHLLAVEWANTYGQIVHLRMLWFNVGREQLQMYPVHLPAYSAWHA